MTALLSREPSRTLKRWLVWMPVTHVHLVFFVLVKNNLCGMFTAAPNKHPEVTLAKAFKRPGGCIEAEWMADQIHQVSWAWTSWPSRLPSIWFIPVPSLGRGMEMQDRMNRGWGWGWGWNEAASCGTIPDQPVQPRRLQVGLEWRWSHFGRWAGSGPQEDYARNMSQMGTN